MHFRIYSRDNCSYCTNAKRLLTSRGYSFTELNSSHDEEAAKFLKDNGFKTVPQIFAASNDVTTHVGGYTALVEFLKTL